VPVVYSIDLVEDPDDCTAAATVSYAESSDGAGSRGNDAVAIEFSPAAKFTGTSGTPEPSGLVLDPAAIAELTGESASVGSAGDDYRDRDSFEIATDALTDELEIRLRWDAAAADLDLFVFESGPGDELSSGIASLVGAGRTESATISVTPGSAYWLWVGAIDGASAAEASYVLTVCGRQFAP
jgi:hypothetical protein